MQGYIIFRICISFLYYFISVYYLINPIVTYTMHTRTHKWNTYEYRMKQNVSMIPFVTSKHITLQITSKIDFD